MQKSAFLRKYTCLIGVLFSLTFINPGFAWIESSSYPIAVIGEKAENYDLVPYLSYSWQEDDVTFEQVRSVFVSGEFAPLQRNYPNIGFVDGSHWFHFSIKNAVGYQRVLLFEVDYAFLDLVEFYCFKDNENPDYHLIGDQLEFEERPLKVRNFVVPLSMWANEKKHCLVRVNSTSHVAFPIRVYDEHTYIEDAQTAERLLGLLYGVALALLLYVLIQYFQLREKIFLYFAMHVIGGMLYTTFSDGSLSAFWIALGLQDSGTIIAIAICAVGAIKFTSLFLQLEPSVPKLKKFGDVTIVVAVGLSLYSLYDPNRFMHIAATVYSLVVSAYLTSCGIKRYFDRFKPAGIYLLGFGAVFFMVAWMVLNTMVLHSDVRWITYGMNLIWVMELLVVSVALSERVRNVEQIQMDLEERMQVMKSESQSKTEFMAKVSHEIRTPMSGMLGLIELLLATPLNKDQKRYIGAIQNAGKGLLEVINDVLDYSRIEAGKMALSSQVFDLKELVSHACAIYEYEARRKRVELGCFIAPGTPLQLIGDATRIRQIILNTLSNALKYTDKGYVHINVQLTDHIHNDKLVLRFEVEDSGIGISKENQEKLFQSYSQVDTSKNRSGAGLGLVISQQFVELMGGEMGVQSELGAGSCFWFNIPLGLPDEVTVADGAVMLDLFSADYAKDEVVVESSEQPVPAVVKQGQKNRVLLVEDNAINQSVMIEFLQKMNLQCELADNGRAAVEKIQSGENYLLILMDCEMPVMDGYEAASKILKWQKSQGQANTPIIALSAHAMEKHQQLAFDAGMVDYIVKPITYQQLHSKITRFLDLGVSAPS